MLYAQRPNGMKSKIEPDFLRIIKVNVLSPVVGTVNVHYENVLNENGSLQVEGFYFGGQFLSRQTDVRGVGFTANYRYYFTQRFPQGWFVQPFLRYQRYWPIVASNFRNTDNIQVGSLGIVFGYQVLAARRISLDIYGGPIYSKLFDKDKRVTRDFIPVLNGPWLRIGCTLGFLF